MIEIESSRSITVNWSPASVREEVTQNVAAILATPRFTVPYDRTLGLDLNYIDDPTQVARALVAADVVATLREREPRVTVSEVLFTGDAGEGILKPAVRVIINE